ncbi:MAG: PIN domain-containing protein, partial [Chloroflexota bacterium]|nr:PIN domain-containing protein [Chloroflexota bacterium]
VQSRAARIVTSNLRHFPPMALAPFEIIAQSPDDFLRELVDADSELVKFLIHRQAAAYRKPAMSVPELLARLEATVPEFAGQMRSRFLVDQL